MNGIMSPSSERRRVQNRISQRNHRMKIRNHIAQLEAKLASTCEKTTNASQTSATTVEPSNLATCRDINSSGRGLDRTDVWKPTDNLLSDGFQDSAWEFDDFIPDYRDTGLDRALVDLPQCEKPRDNQDFFDASSPNEPTQLPTPSLDDITPNCSSPGDSAHSNCHNRGQQHDSEDEPTYLSFPSPESAATIARKRKRPPQASQPGRSSPALSTIRENTRTHCRDTSLQHGWYDRLDESFAAATQSPCCGQHRHRTSSRHDSATRQDTKQASSIILKVNPGISPSGGTPFPLSLSEDQRQHVPHASQSCQVARCDSAPQTPTHAPSPAYATPRQAANVARAVMAYCPNCACQQPGANAAQFGTIRIPKNLLHLVSSE